METKIEIVCIKDFPKSFQDYWGGFNSDIHKNGWKTWTNKEDLEDDKVFSKDGLGEIQRLIPENNKYGINFPKSHFKIKES